MNTLFFDTETSGLPKNYKAPVTDLDNWPRLVQLGWILYCDADSPDPMIMKGETIVFPDGFMISESVSKIHGITQETATHDGKLIRHVLYEFNSLLEQADLLVGHNISYDLNVLGAEFIRLINENPLSGKATYDTMLKGMDVCKIPGKYGQYKWPKLTELYFSLFQTPLPQTHTALDDIENTAKCYFEMKARGL